MNTHRLADFFNFQMQTTHANIARYEGFKSSGKIGTIEDDSLKQAIRQYADAEDQAKKIIKMIDASLGDR